MTAFFLNIAIKVINFLSLNKNTKYKKIYIFLLLNKINTKIITYI